jgi:hypothetical protein
MCRLKVQKRKDMKMKAKTSARTPRRIAAAKKYRDEVRNKDELTKAAVDRIVRHFVCPNVEDEQ